MNQFVLGESKFTIRGGEGGLPGEGGNDLSCHNREREAKAHCLKDIDPTSGLKNTALLCVRNQRLLPKQLVESYGVKLCGAFEFKLNLDGSGHVFVELETIRPLDDLSDLESAGDRFAGFDQFTVGIK